MLNFAWPPRNETPWRRWPIDSPPVAITRRSACVPPPDVPNDMERGMRIVTCAPRAADASNCTPRARCSSSSMSMICWEDSSQKSWPSAFSREGDAVLRHQRDEILRCEARQRRAAEVQVLRQIVRRPGADVGEIAAAAAGMLDFRRSSGHGQSAPRRPRWPARCAEEAGGASADDDCVEVARSAHAVNVMTHWPHENAHSPPVVVILQCGWRATSRASSSQTDGAGGGAAGGGAGIDFAARVVVCAGADD